jgi:isopentenyl phosphate kinase
MPKKQLLLLKLGGSVITDKSQPYTAKTDHIHALAKVLKQSTTPLIISHGSGSFGHTSAAKYGGMHGYNSKIGIATVANDAMTINSIVTSILIKEGLPAISLRPMSFLTSKNGKLAETFFSPLQLLLQQGLTPVVYGDVVMDQTWKTTIFSGETTLNHVALYLKRQYAPQVIELCDVPGVLDAENNVISEITSQTWSSVKSLSVKQTEHDVTGGMLHKVEEALHLAKHGILTHIIDGRDPHVLEKVLEDNDQVGTRIHL